MTSCSEAVLRICEQIHRHRAMSPKCQSIAEPASSRTEVKHAEPVRRLLLEGGEDLTLEVAITLPPHRPLAGETASDVFIR